MKGRAGFKRMPSLPGFPARKVCLEGNLVAMKSDGFTIPLAPAKMIPFMYAPSREGCSHSPYIRHGHGSSVLFRRYNFEVRNSRIVSQQASPESLKPYSGLNIFRS